MNGTEHSILLRPARAELEEGLHFAHYLDQAAEGFFRILLGRESESIIATAFLESGHALSYENVIFVETNTKIVGMCSSFTEQQHKAFSDEPLQRAAKRNAIRLKLMDFLFAPLRRVLEKIPEGDFYILAIAIDPELRGAGIGSFIINDIENRAKDNGASSISLDVSANNHGARKLYEKLGMVESSTWPNSRILPTVLIRMSKTLK